MWLLPVFLWGMKWAPKILKTAKHQYTPIYSVQQVFTVTVHSSFCYEFVPLKPIENQACITCCVMWHAWIMIFLPSLDLKMNPSVKSCLSVSRFVLYQLTSTHLCSQLRFQWTSSSWASARLWSLLDAVLLRLSSFCSPLISFLLSFNLLLSENR